MTLSLISIVRARYAPNPIEDFASKNPEIEVIDARVFGFHNKVYNVPRLRGCHYLIPDLVVGNVPIKYLLNRLVVSHMFATVSMQAATETAGLCLIEHFSCFIRKWQFAVEAMMHKVMTVWLRT
jgi:hypothetical protein